MLVKSTPYVISTRYSFLIRQIKEISEKNVSAPLNVKSFFFCFSCKLADFILSGSIYVYYLSPYLLFRALSHSLCVSICWPGTLSLWLFYFASYSHSFSLSLSLILSFSVFLFHTLSFKFHTFVSSIFPFFLFLSLLF